MLAATNSSRGGSLLLMVRSYCHYHAMQELLGVVTGNEVLLALVGGSLSSLVERCGGDRMFQRSVATE